MTTNAQLYDLILTRARRAGDPTLRTVLPNELRQMVQAWERSPFMPWFLEKTSSGLVTVTSADTINEPSDYLLIVENTKVYSTNTSNTRTKLTRAYHEDIEESFNGIDPGPPTHFDIFGGKIYFGPTPDAVYTIRMKYYAKTTPPPDDNNVIDNQWAINAEDLFITESAYRLQASYIKDMKVAAELRAQSNSIRSELHKYNEARKHVEMDYAVDR